MKIYYSNIAGCDFHKNKIDIPNIGVLISYYGLSSLKVPPYCDSLFLDSGAFSAWTQKTKIDIYVYIDFIKKHETCFSVYAALDHIESEKKSITNYQRMKKAGLSPLPTYHIGEDLSTLKFYIDHTSYIALGGIAKVHKNFRIPWLDSIFEKYPDPEKIGFHGFGIQDEILIKRYPWKSVDASSCHMQARYGGIYVPGIKGRGRWVKINPEVNSKELKWRSPASESFVKEWVEKCGVNYEEAIKNTPKGCLLRAKINILYFEEIAKIKSFIFKRKSQSTLF